MNIILLSGDCGRRLWPLSNGVRSREFLQILKSPDGEYESMAQRVYRQIMEIDENPRIVVVASKLQVPAVRNQIGEDVEICVEPSRRYTFPSVALASIWMLEKMNLEKDSVVIVCPLDIYADDTCFSTLKEMENLVKYEKTNLVLLGIEPTYPSENHGYVLVADKKKVSRGIIYYDDPPKGMVGSLIEQGALWSGGTFALRLSYLQNRIQKLLPFFDYEDLFRKFEEVPESSLEQMLLGSSEDWKTVRFTGGWKKLETWNTLAEVMEEDVVGKAELDKSCHEVYVINELNIPILCIGVKDIVISASPDGILVSDKIQSRFAESLLVRQDKQVMFSDKSWGSFQVLDIDYDSMTIKVILKPGHRMNYHSHERRDEVWTVLSGQGRAIVDGMEEPITVGDVITMQAGCRHTVIAETELHIIEVQLGSWIDVSDKRKYELGE